MISKRNTTLFIKPVLLIQNIINNIHNNINKNMNEIKKFERKLSFDCIKSEIFVCIHT